MSASSGINMAVIMLGIFIIIVVVAIVFPIVAVIKRKKARDKENMDLFNEINQNNESKR